MSAELVGSACGPYRILSELGAGAMGTVYLAEVEGEPDRGPVALKMLHPHLLRRKGFFTRFRREAEAGRQVDHPNVVRTIDCDLMMVGDRLCYFLVMEYAEGQTLRELLGELGRVPEALLREIAIQASAGLAAIHAEGIVHRDLKPENVLLADDQRVRIMDLGVAKLENTTEAITLTGKVAGSLPYVAPEQIRQERVGAASDLYSLGVMLHELASGRNAFHGSSAAAVLYAHLNLEPEPPENLSPFFAAVLRSLLAKHPGERIGSAAALHRTLVDGEESRWWAERREDPGLRLPPGLRIPVRRETKLYGREAELSSLRRCWEGAKEGRGAAVRIEGEAGIGKTRLVDSFVRAIAGEGARVLYGSFSPSGDGDALCDALIQHFGEDLLEQELSWYLDRVPELVPAFVSLVRHRTLPPDVAPLEPGSLPVIWGHLLKALCAERPLLWVAEDLQFAAPESRRTLLALARQLREQRILFVSTSREPVGKDEFEEYDRGARFERVPLRRLRPAEVVRLLQDAFRNRELAEQLGPRIAEKSDGVPFFVCEMIRGLSERRFLSEEPDGRIVQARVIDRIEVPSAVRDLIEARLSDLAPEERNILDVGAVQGFEFDPAVTAAVLELEKVTVLQHIALLERRLGVVHGEERTARFDHHQVQEVLYDAVSPPLRAEYHTRVARALDERTHLVAHHHLRGVHPEEAFDTLGASLELLAAEGRHEARVELADLALAAGASMSAPVAVETLLHRAASLGLLGRRDEEAATLARAAEQARGDDELRLRVLVRLTQAAQARRALEECAGVLDEALELARRREDRAAEAELLLVRGAAFAAGGRLEEAVGLQRRAVELARAAGDSAVEGLALSDLGSSLLQLARYDGARLHCDRARYVLHRRGRRTDETIALLNLAAADRLLGDPHAARERGEQAMVLAASVGFRGGEGLASEELGRSYLVLGRWAQARERFEAALRLARETRDVALEARAQAGLGRYWLDVGRLLRAQECVAESLRLHELAGDRLGVEAMRAQAGYLGTLAGGDGGGLEQAHVALLERDALALANEVLFLRGDAAFDPDVAATHFARCLRLARERFERVFIAETLLALGRAERTLGDAPSARRRLEEARELADAAALPHVAAEAGIYMDAGAGARDEFLLHEPRLPHRRRMAAHFALYEAGAGDLHRDRARALLGELRDGAPAGLDRVPLHLRIDASKSA